MTPYSVKRKPRQNDEWILHLLFWALLVGGILIAIYSWVCFIIAMKEVVL